MGEQRRIRRTGPLVLVLPFLFLILGVLHMLRQRPPQRLAPPPAVEDPEETVAGLSGELPGAGGARLEAWLAPLHADPARQRLDAAALRGRLGLPPGEPWRLTLSYEVPAGERRALPRPAGTLGPQGAPRAEPAPVETIALGLGPVSVHDGGGEALTVAVEPQPELLAPADPLRSLLLPPPGVLRPGQSAEWILWGRVPVGSARLVGLLPDPDTEEGDVFAEATGLRGPLELRPRPVRRSELQLPLAQLERPPPDGLGKTPAPPASDGSRAPRLEADAEPSKD